MKGVEDINASMTKTALVEESSATIKECVIPKKEDQDQGVIQITKVCYFFLQKLQTLPWKHFWIAIKMMTVLKGYLNVKRCNVVHLAKAIEIW